MPIPVASTAANGFSASSTQRAQDGQWESRGESARLLSPLFVLPSPPGGRAPGERPEAAQFSSSVWGARLKAKILVTRTVSLLRVCGRGRAPSSSGR